MFEPTNQMSCRASHLWRYWLGAAGLQWIYMDLGQEDLFNLNDSPINWGGFPEACSAFSFYPLNILAIRCCCFNNSEIIMVKSGTVLSCCLLLKARQLRISERNILNEDHAILICKCFQDSVSTRNATSIHLRKWSSRWLLEWRYEGPGYGLIPSCKLSWGHWRSGSLRSASASMLTCQSLTSLASPHPSGAKCQLAAAERIGAWKKPMHEISNTWGKFPSSFLPNDQTSLKSGTPNHKSYTYQTWGWFLPPIHSDLGPLGMGFPRPKRDPTGPTAEAHNVDIVFIHDLLGHGNPWILKTWWFIPVLH